MVVFTIHFLLITTADRTTAVEIVAKVNCVENQCDKVRQEQKEVDHVIEVREIFIRINPKHVHYVYYEGSQNQNTKCHDLGLQSEAATARTIVFRIVSLLVLETQYCINVLFIKKLHFIIVFRILL